MNIPEMTLPPPTLEDVDYELWGQNVKADMYTTAQVRAILGARDAQYAAMAGQGPVEWQYRWTNPGDNPNASEDELAWKPIEPKLGQTHEQRLAGLKAYRYGGKPCYEVRPLYAHPAPATPAALERMVADFPALSAFHEKHALGPMRAPSCLCCGQLPESIAIKHAELPGIVICTKCRDATTENAKLRADIGAMVRDDVDCALSAAQERAEPVAPAAQADRSMFNRVYEQHCNKPGLTIREIAWRCFNAGALLSATPPAPAQPAPEAQHVHEASQNTETLDGSQHSSQQQTQTQAVPEADAQSPHEKANTVGIDARGAASVVGDAARPRTAVLNASNPSKPEQAEAPSAREVAADLVRRYCKPVDEEVHEFDRGFEAGRIDDAVKIATRLAGLYKQIEDLTRDRDEWKQQHENLLFVRQQDLAALTATLPPASAAGDGGAGERELLNQALDALSTYQGFIDDAHILEGQWHWLDDAKAADASIRAALATKPQAEQEAAGKSLNARVADQLRPFLKPGDKVIWRDSFRWKDDDGVLSNHYDSMGLPQLADDFGYEIDWDFNMNHAAIIRSASNSGGAAS